MARQLDKKQKGELADFLDRLYQLGGYSTQSSWAAEAQVHPVNLSNALNRKNLKGIDAFSLVSLLRAASDRIGSDPTDVAAAAATPRAVTLAELAVLMQAAREAQEKQWADIRRLAGAVDALATALSGLDEFVRSVLPRSNSARGRQQRGA
jgi:hypothetical protein